MPLAAAVVHFGPVGGATYFGIAAGARDRAVESAMAAARGPRALTELPRVQRQVGLMDVTLRTAWWACWAPSTSSATTTPRTQAMTTVMVAKRQAVTGAIEVVDLAMDVIGGRSYFRRRPTRAGVPRRAGGHVPPVHAGGHAELRGQARPRRHRRLGVGRGRPGRSPGRAPPRSAGESSMNRGPDRPPPGARTGSRSLRCANDEGIAQLHCPPVSPRRAVGARGVGVQPAVVLGRPDP